MRVLVQRAREQARADDWPSDLTQLLEEHHVCAWSREVPARAEFVHRLRAHLHAIPDSETVLINGHSGVDGLRGRADAPQAAGRPGDAHADTETALLHTLRARNLGADGRPFKRRFIVWDGAHEALASDPARFARGVDALLGTAAEAEYASEDLLLIQRVIFVGSPALDIYADQASGQFRSWLREDRESPLWQVVTGIPYPLVASVHIDQLLRA